MKTDYSVPIKKYHLLIFFSGAGTIALGVLILSIPFLAISQPDFVFRKEFIGYFIFFPIFLNYFMWFAFGVEKLFFTDNIIEVVKSNGLFSTKSSVNICEIESVAIKRKKYPTDRFIDVRRERIREKRGAFPFWIKMGQIILTTKNGEKTILNGLSDKEALEMKKHIETEIEQRCAKKAK